jgi:hypothetical protein
VAAWDGPQDKKNGNGGYPHGGGANDSCLIALVLMPFTLPVMLLQKLCGLR